MPLGNSNNNNNNHSRRSRRRGRNGGGGGGGDNGTNNNSGNGNGNDGGDDDNVLSLIHVSFRDEWYQLEGVATMADVLEQLPRQSRQSSSSSSKFTNNNNNNNNSNNDNAPSTSIIHPKDLVNAKLLYRGKILEQPPQPSQQKNNNIILLKQAGIKEGDRIFVVPENYRFRPHEALAIFLEMMAREEEEQEEESSTSSGNNGSSSGNTSSSHKTPPLAKMVSQWQENGGSDFFQWWWSSFIANSSNPNNSLQRDQIAQTIRSSVDLGYHRLRMLWERPSFRQAMKNPKGLEAYRKVLVHHLPKSIQKELSPSTRQFLSSPQAWKNQILKVTEAFLQLGDVILDGLLDIVLDVVQGAGGRGRNNNNNRAAAAAGQQPPQSLSSQFTSSRRTTTQQQHHDHYEPDMEDPSMANQMLFELSESEED